MKIHIPEIPGINIPAFEISHSNSVPTPDELATLHGAKPKKGRDKGVIIAVTILALLLLGGRRNEPPKTT